MLKEQCISVTELRTNTKECLTGLEKEPKYIFLNNRPIAVLLDIDEYEKAMLMPQLVELKANEVSEELLKSAMSARKSKKSELVNL